MLKFWKRKKKEDVEEETDELEEESKPKKKRTPRKKEEPAKPWGRRERLLVLSVFLFTIIASSAASIRSNGFELPEIGGLNIKKPAFNLFQEEKIVLYGTQDQEKDPTEIINQILDRTSYLQGEYSFVVVRLDTGYKYGVNDDNIMPAASLVKLPVMAGMFKAAEEKKIDLDNEYVLKSVDKVDGSGSLANQPEGYRTSYENLIRLMGKESDNTAFRIARTIVGPEIINEVLQDSRMSNTSIDDNETTPEDVASFYENLWKGNIINSDHREDLLSFLTDTIYEDWIPRGVEENIRVAHKYGVLEDVVNDAGIIYSDQKYILVIMSSGVSREEANSVIPEISRKIFEFESS